MNHLQIANLWINSLMKGFDSAGLDLDSLTSGLPEFRNNRLPRGQQLPLSSARTLWHRAEQQAQDPILGIKVGAQQNFRSSGVLMPICWHSPSPRKALEHIAQFQKLISENGLYKLKEITLERHSILYCEYLPSANPVAANEQQILSVVTGTIALLREISERDIIIHKLLIPMPLNATLIGMALDCTTENHKGNFCLLLDPESLEATIESRDPHLYEINLAYAENLIRSMWEGQNLLDQIKKVIDVSHPALMTIEDVALELRIHSRVIQRHLAEMGKSFRELKVEVLKERAIDGLIHRGQDSEQVSQILGYSEVSAFHRAFKNWFGVTPKQFQRKHHG